MPHVFNVNTLAQIHGPEIKIIRGKKDSNEEIDHAYIGLGLELESLNGTCALKISGRLGAPSNTCQFQHVFDKMSDNSSYPQPRCYKSQNK